MAISSLTTRQQYRALNEDDRETEFYIRELKIKRLERLIINLLAWEEGSPYYNNTVREWEEYCDE